MEFVMYVCVYICLYLCTVYISTYLLGAEPFVFQFAIQKFKDQDI